DSQCDLISIRRQFVLTRGVEIHDYPCHEGIAAVQPDSDLLYAFLVHRNVLLASRRRCVGEDQNQAIGRVGAGNSWLDGRGETELHLYGISAAAHTYVAEFRDCPRRLRSTRRGQQQNNSEFSEQSQRSLPSP